MKNYKHIKYRGHVFRCYRTQTFGSTKFDNLEYCSTLNNKHFVNPAGCEKYAKIHGDGKYNLAIAIQKINTTWILRKYSDASCMRGMRPIFTSTPDEIPIVDDVLYPSINAQVLLFMTVT